jgi:hypothetical protein
MKIYLVADRLICIVVCLLVFIYCEWKHENLRYIWCILLNIRYYISMNCIQTTCPSPLWARIPTGTLDSFMWGSYPASLRNVGVSTQVPVRAWNNARKGTWGLPPPVKLEHRDMTYTVSMWRKTQNKTKKMNIYVVNSIILLLYNI